MRPYLCRSCSLWLLSALAFVTFKRKIHLLIFDNVMTTEPIEEGPAWYQLSFISTSSSDGSHPVSSKTSPAPLPSPPTAGSVAAILSLRLRSLSRHFLHVLVSLGVTLCFFSALIFSNVLTRPIDSHPCVYFYCLLLFQPRCIIKPNSFLFNIFFVRQQQADKSPIYHCSCRQLQTKG